MEGTIRWITGFMGESENPTEPLTAIYYPIVADSLDSVSVSKSADTKLVGVLAL
jgi:hypothetical protein